MNFVVWAALVTLGAIAVIAWRGRGERQIVGPVPGYAITPGALVSSENVPTPEGVDVISAEFLNSAERRRLILTLDSTTDALDLSWLSRLGAGLLEGSEVDVVMICCHGVTRRPFELLMSADGLGWTGEALDQVALATREGARAELVSRAKLAGRAARFFGEPEIGAKKEIDAAGAGE